MKNILTLFFITCISICSAQLNLIINADFEDTLGCPNQINQVNLSSGWNSYGGTPDLFHTCANTSTPYFGVPVNARGYQQPHSGNAYCGIYTFAKFIPNGREFLGRQLAAPLVIGQQYFVSFWVNHVDTSQAAFATDNLGVKFSTVAYSTFNPDSVNNQPHIFTTTVLTDTANWVKVCGSFIADSAYLHIEIGNFFDDASTDTVRILQNPFTNYAYYLIDDVCLSSDSSVCSCEGLQSIVEQNNFDVGVFPSPANGFVTVKSKQKLFEIKLADVNGSVVLQNSFSGFTGTLNTQLLADGFYFLQIQTGNSIINKKLVVRH